MVHRRGGGGGGGDVYKRQDGTPIEGLYAAGEVTVGMSGVSSMALGYACGSGVFSA